MMNTISCGKDSLLSKVQFYLIATGVFWVLVAVAASILQHRVISQRSIKIDGLEGLIPRSFGGWLTVDDTLAPIVDARLEQSLRSDYSDVISRTYLNADTGQRVMLSIAYGADQSHDKQIHKPEVCYAAQGFVIDSMRKVDWRIESRPVLATALHAQRDERSEYIVYWIVLGQSIVRGAWDQNLTRAKLAFHGISEDGLLFRVSTLSRNQDASERALNQFSEDLVSAESPALREKLIGVRGR